jgi:hypothetical protein
MPDKTPSNDDPVPVTLSAAHRNLLLTGLPKADKGLLKRIAAENAGQPVHLRRSEMVSLLFEAVAELVEATDPDRKARLERLGTALQRPFVGNRPSDLALNFKKCRPLLDACRSRLGLLNLMMSGTLQAAMKAREPTPVKSGDTVPVRLSKAERRLVLDHTFADRETVDRLRVVKAGNSVYRFTLADLEALQGQVAAAANHEKDRKRKKLLDALWKKLDDVAERYVDADE